MRVLCKKIGKIAITWSTKNLLKFEGNLSSKMKYSSEHIVKNIQLNILRIEGVITF